MGKRKEKKGQKGGRKEKGKERKEKSIERRNEEMAESSGRSRLGTNSIGIATGGGQVGPGHGAWRTENGLEVRR